LQDPGSSLMLGGQTEKPAAQLNGLPSVYTLGYITPSKTKQQIVSTFLSDAPYFEKNTAFGRFQGFARVSWYEQHVDGDECGALVEWD
jgi:hypothetical protein